jgi:hypothetical protein
MMCVEEILLGNSEVACTSCLSPFIQTNQQLVQIGCCCCLQFRLVGLIYLNFIKSLIIVQKKGNLMVCYEEEISSTDPIIHLVIGTGMLSLFLKFS